MNARIQWLGQSFSHAQARKVIESAYRSEFGDSPTLCEAQFAQTIALIESQYGSGWGGAGAGSNNWGAVQAGKPPCDPATSFTYTDTHPTDTGQSIPYSICFRKYSTPEAGAAHMIRILYKQMPRVSAAALRCDSYGVSAAMYDSRYYEGFGATREARIANHHKAVLFRLKQITTALKEPMPVAKAGSGGILDKIRGITPVQLLAGAAVAGGAWWYFRRR